MHEMRLLTFFLIVFTAYSSPVAMCLYFLTTAVAPLHSKANIIVYHGNGAGHVHVRAKFSQWRVSLFDRILLCVSKHLHNKRGKKVEHVF